MKNEIDTLKPDIMSQRPIVLAVETSSRIGSVALALGGEILAETLFSTPLMHSAEIFPAITALLKRAKLKPGQIEHVYISAGPGSFTGLRIAVTLAKIMHLANAVKVIAVDTLDVIAYNVVDYIGENVDTNRQSGKSKDSVEKIAIILDAKRGQFFTAVYNCCFYEADLQNAVFCKHFKKASPDSLMSASEVIAEFAEMGKPIWLLGDGLVYHKDKFKSQGVCFFEQKYWSPRANKVHRLGWQLAGKGMFTDPVDLKPLYLRRPDVKIRPQ